jgi:hypothetical protein
MTRSRKQKAAARNHSVAESTSYVNAFYKTKSPFTGKFAKTLELADKHGNWYYSHNPTGVLSEWEKTTAYCLDDCDCAEKLEPERQRFWKDVFSFLPADEVPFLAGTEFVIPTYTAWLRDRKPDDTEPYTPIIFATFAYPDDLGYSDFIGVPDKLQETLAGHAVTVMPVGKIDGSGEEISGTAGDKGFRVAIMETGTVERFSHDDHKTHFSLLELSESSLWGFKNTLGISSSMLTVPSSPGNICELKFSTHGSLTADEMRLVANLLREKTNAQWTAVSEDYALYPMEDEHLRVYAAYFSDHPSTTFTGPEYVFTPPRSAIPRMLRNATSGEKKWVDGLPSVFSGGDIIPVGYSDCVVERNQDGIIVSLRHKKA